MNRIFSTFLLPTSVFLSIACCTQAQEGPPPLESPRPPQEGFRRGNRENPPRFGQNNGEVREQRMRERIPGSMQSPPPPGMGDPVRRYMNQLKEKSPKRHERLQALQQENPAEFRKALRIQMSDDILQKKLGDFQELTSALREMSPERRAELAHRLMGAPHPTAAPSPGSGEGRRGLPGPSASVGKMRELSEKLQQAKSDSDRASIREELLRTATAAFDQNIQDRQKRLEQIEADIAHIREEIKKQQEHRDRIISERIDRLLERPNTSVRRNAGSPRRNAPPPPEAEE